ncbi:DUF3013 family protein [Vagococcus xieshaowenii]|uniref:DUF3013 family protein n=1 Tax=Vagococcus xieshaowenii TaxID=2562451 RepID=A0AAJ5EH62_9ENTE|nr:DUF3013 family protein [Vagococcus xieshaowenii]QCA29219.1 DUF3013 family protein [Vagococcus xieshaowenii]TFZ43268.1 DUF3013 family protein [Vagococcus xieshaowenii]
MKKMNMLEYLDKQLEKEMQDYDFAIDWNTKAHTVEVMVVLYAHNNKSVTIADLDGIESEEEVIEFEDAILLAPEGKFTGDPDDYLAVLPYAGKKGMKQGTITAIAKYLYQVVAQGESDLMDFLQDETQEVFELYWDQDAFAAIEAEQLAKSQGQTEWPYPRY